MASVKQSVQAWLAGGRSQALAAIQATHHWDLIIVGGGITGAGIYREAACRGLKVLLLEQRDFAWGSSSRSSKMVHGGLRYLGSGQFKLAYESVSERQKLLHALPGLVKPLPFLWEHRRGVFPGPWLFDKVVMLYDWMAGERSRQFIPQSIREFWVPGFRQDISGMTRYNDGVTDDARLVMRVLHEGNTQGGWALNYVRALSPLTTQGRVTGLQVQDESSSAIFSLKARCVINATGAWTDSLRSALGQDQVIRPLRGSHFAVPYARLPLSFAVGYFHPQDKRPVFVFPWEGVTVVGTTDLDHDQGLNQEAHISEQELAYLLHGVNSCFPDAALCREDILSTWAGVRPVVATPAKEGSQTRPSDEKREHVVLDDGGLISIAGGKLTTYRLLALEVLTQALPYLKHQLTAAQLRQPYPFTSVSSAPPAGTSPAEIRLWDRYGSVAPRILAQGDEAKVLAGTQTLLAELRWSAAQESVQHLDDLLLRRTRIGLLLPEGGRALLSQIRQVCQEALGWSDPQWQAEVERYLAIIAHYYSLPQPGEG